MQKYFVIMQSYENVLEEDSDSNSEKEDYSTKRNLILEASLNKLALLEKELSVFEDNLVNQRKSDLNKNEVSKLDVLLRLKATFVQFPSKS